jgi:hypothetical protein
MQALISSNREAIDETNIPIRNKNKYVNFLFYNCEVEEPTFYKTTICFFIIFLVSLGLAIFFYVEVSSVIEVSHQYYSPGSSPCSVNTTCNVTISIDEDMHAPVYFMYYLGIWIAR